MAFTEGVELEVNQIEEGEVLSESPYNIDSYEKFEDGLVIGRFAKLDAGSVDNLDNSATPLIVGVPKRKVNKTIDSGVYVSTPVNGLADKNADIVNFGRVTVVLSDLAIAAATVTEGDPVYVVNSATPALAGKVTDNSGEADAIAVTGAVFKKEKQSGIWIVTIQNYLV
jgi:hypothetical protein